MAEFLLEIGVEELPARFIPSALHQIRELVEGSLKEQGITPEAGELRYWGTPRRLVLYGKGLPEQTPARKETILGPPWEQAFPGGAPAPQALGFARRFQLSPQALVRVETKRGVFAAAVLEVPGIPLKELLATWIPQWLRALNFPRMMRWQEGGLSFARPIRWLIPLWNEELLPLELPGIPVQRSTTGPRFSPASREIPAPGSYEKILRRMGVILAPEERKKRIVREATRILSQEGEGLEVLWDEELLQEIVYLCEWPQPGLGSFPSHYLALPEIVIRTVLRDHQRCFVVQSPSGRLAPYFLFVMNRRHDGKGEVRKGNERVVRARLEDAWFYFCEDLGIPLDHPDADPDPARLRKMGESLQTMGFLEGMGSMAERRARIQELSLKLYELCGAPAGKEGRYHLEVATALFLSDLGSKMVYEYPELAGRMTPIYARRFKSYQGKEIPQPALEILEEAILPEGEERFPRTLGGAIVAIMQRLDLLLSHAARNHYPTGAKDPFGLKNLCEELIALLAHTPFPRLSELLSSLAPPRFDPHGSMEEPLPAFPWKGFWVALFSRVQGAPSPEELSQNLLPLPELLYDRLEAALIREGFPPPWARGVVARVGFHPWAARTRLLALRTLASAPDFPRFLDTYKRFRNISREVVYRGYKGEGAPLEPAEEAFLAALDALEPEYGRALEGEPSRALALLKGLVLPAERLFAEVRIEHPDPFVRERRKALVARARTLFQEYLHWDHLLEG